MRVLDQLPGQQKKGSPSGTEQVKELLDISDSSVGLFCNLHKRKSYLWLEDIQESSHHEKRLYVLSLPRL
ncbi:hypothetical protein GDO81_012924 [Engystomops pustulosus]|uniref:Uncharacterized protein n=1 Tax=Engystomops pustulosus TaxID=76066 RepID=A0AAV7B031_ENGPU|nr:hypothetical protein GDO81_012924 [Engystomops pustulosus]